MSKLEIIYKEASDLIHLAGNPRQVVDKQACDKLKILIQEHGFQNPLQVFQEKDGKYSIICGNHRFDAGIELGIKEFPCIVYNGTKQQALARAISDNRSSEWTDWDIPGLKDMIVELDDGSVDIETTGFTQAELEEMFGIVSEIGLTDEDAVPEIPDEPISKEGDTWVLGNHRLMCGDSTSIDAVEKLMDGQKADMVFTDPPYGVDYKGIMNDNESGLADLLDQAFSNYLMTSKSGASIYVFHADRTSHIFREAFNRYFHFSSMIIWAKNSLTLSQTDYQSQHEPCLYGWMDNGTHSWHSDRKQTSVWRFDKERVEGHTTPKPVALVERAITNSSKSGDSIIDLFGGSGSTLIACEKINRHARLMELDPKYVDVTIKRWEDFTGGKAKLING
jgi:DNA modification methylase